MAKFCILPKQKKLPHMSRVLFGILINCSLFDFSVFGDVSCKSDWMLGRIKESTELVQKVENNPNSETNTYKYPSDANVSIGNAYFECKKGQSYKECSPQIYAFFADKEARELYCDKPKGNNSSNQQNNSDFGTAKCPLACHTNPATRQSLVQRDWKNCSDAGKKEFDNDFQKYVAKTEESCAEWEKNKSRSPKKKEAEKQKNETKTTEVSKYAKIELANTEQAYRLIEMENPGVNVSSCVVKTNVTIKGRPQDTLTCDKSNEKIRFEFDDLSDRDNSQNGTVYASLQQYFCGKVDKNLTSGDCMNKVAKVWSKEIKNANQESSESPKTDEQIKQESNLKSDVQQIIDAYNKRKAELESQKH